MDLEKFHREVSVIALQLFQRRSRLTPSFFVDLPEALPLDATLVERAGDSISKTEDRNHLLANNLQVGQPQEKTSLSQWKNARTVIFVAAIIGTGTLSALLFFFVLPLAAIGAGAGGIVILALMGKFYFLRDASTPKETPPPQPPEPASSEEVEVPRSSGDVTHENPKPSDDKGEILCTGNFAPVPGGYHITWEPANSQQPAAEPRTFSVTDITPGQAVESMENFSKKCSMSNVSEFKKKVSESSRNCRRLDPGQTKKLAEERLREEVGAKSRKERNFAAGLPEDFFEGASSGNYDGCEEKLGSSNFTILLDALRGEFWSIKGRRSSCYLGVADTGPSFSREGAVKRLIKVICESYDNNSMRLRALRNFLGGSYFQGVACVLMDTIQLVDPNQEFYRQLIPSGKQSRYSSVRFNGDATVTFRSYFGGSGPFHEAIIASAEESGGPISQDSFVFMAVKYTTGTPFDAGNPSAFPDGWAEATREKAIPPIIAVDVEYADFITR
jgi:hypothetical protein